MMDQDEALLSGQAINIGIYGGTKAGKTRFLFQLLNHWEKTHRLLRQSPTCQRFLATVGSQIEKHGESAPTVATTENISVTVQREGNEGPLDLVFRDLRGELLSGQLDRIDSLTRKDVIPKQVKKCDAFLFFFDPASSEDPEGINKHHDVELKRARMFIEYVLQVRENRHLPIVFVLTHLDCWENDEEVRVKAEHWVRQAQGELVKLYDASLRRFYPKSIVDPTRTAFRVSSVEDTEEAKEQLEKVIVELADLVADSRAHRRRLRKTGLYALVSCAVVLSLLLFLVWVLYSTGGSPPPSRNGNDRIVVAEMSENEIRKRLDELDGILKAHPHGTQLPSGEEAEKLNYHLRWLTLLMEPDSGRMTDLSEKTKQRMRSALDSVADVVQEKKRSRVFLPSELLPILAAYLKDLPDLASISPDLAECQTYYWELQRTQAVERVASVIRRRDEVASSPIDTLDEVINELRSIEEEVRRSKVFGPQAREDLVQEIQTVATFCEDRKKTMSYQAKFRVVSARYESRGKVGLAWRAIALKSPGQPAVNYSLEPRRTSDTQLSFHTKQSSYQVKLGLGGLVTCGVSVWEGEKWRHLHEFDLATDPGPLAPLGLPLPRRAKPAVTKRLQWKGMELEIELSEFSPVPPLIWDAATKAREAR